MKSFYDSVIIANPTLDWSYRELIDGRLYRLKNGCNWEDSPKDLPPCLSARSLAPQSDTGSHRYSTIFYYYNQWRKAGAIEKLMRRLPERVREQVKKPKVYPKIMNKIRFELAPKPSKAEKAAQGKTGFVPIATRWVIERSNAWMERCKSLTKNFERTVVDARAQMDFCFVRLMIQRLAANA